jgi:LacI family transcriptional regulator
MNNPDRVAEATRLRVQAVIDRLDFVPNRPAADLRSGRSRMVALVVPDIANPFFAEVARGAVAAAAEQGYVVVLCSSDGDPAKEDGYLELLDEQRVAGVLINPVGNAPGRLSRMRDHGTSVVFVDRAARASEFCSVAVDDVRGGELAAELLLRRGARELVLINGPLALRQCADRRKGARRGIERLGLPSSTLVEFRTLSMTIQPGVEAAERMLKEIPHPRSVFCTNDLLAIGVTRWLAKAGVSVPEQVEVVGYDDIEIAAEAPIPLTSIRQPKYELGRTAAELLVRDIEEGPAHRHQRVVFQPHLVERDSTMDATPDVTSAHPGRQVGVPTPA